MSIDDVTPTEDKVDDLAQRVVVHLREHAHRVREAELESSQHSLVWRLLIEARQCADQKTFPLVLRAVGAFMEQPDLDLTAARAGCWVQYDHVDLEGLARRLSRLRRSTNGVLGRSAIG